jgi:hypothetical protein|nr:MAG TPA: Protein of unknown function (DUF2577) [Caudoviricetes sp.]
MDASMLELVNTLKEMMYGFVENRRESDLIYAVYNGDSLQLDNKPNPIPLDMVDIPLHLQKIEAELSLTVGKDDVNRDGQKILSATPEIESVTLRKAPVTLFTGLQPGDRVAVVQKRGGQRFSIIDRVV